MKNITWLVSVVVAFGSGYFFHAASAKNNAPKSDVVAIAATLQSAVVQPTTRANRENISSSSSAIHAAAPIALKITKPVDVLPPSTEVQDVVRGTPSLSQASEISDAEIDKILPAPFNDVIKNNHGHDRDLYKKFSEASEPRDWDIKMQSKLSDAILSSPYANSLSIDSILCKGDVCEVRVFEHKDGVWALIMAEMRMQTWWDFAANSSYGFAFMQDSKVLTGNLALFVRKESNRFPQ